MEAKKMPRKGFGYAVEIITLMAFAVGFRLSAETNNEGTAPELDRLNQQFRSAIESRAEAPYRESLTTLKVQYESVLANYMQQAKSEGNLDLFLSLKDEVQAVRDESLSPESGVSELASQRAIYFQHKAALEAQRSRQVSGLVNIYLSQLSGLKSSLEGSPRAFEVVSIDAAIVSVRQEFETILTNVPAAAEAPGEAVPAGIPAGVQRPSAQGSILTWHLNHSPESPLPGHARPPEVHDAVALAAPISFTTSPFVLCLRANGDVIAWGDPGNGMLKIFPVKELHHVVSMACSHGHALALREDGSIVSWSQQDVSILPPPTDSAIIQLAATRGGWYSLHANGKIKGKGRSPEIPENLQGRICYVTTSDQDVLLVLDDGSLWYSGKDGKGAGAIPPDLKNVVACTMHPQLALIKDSNRPVTWGAGSPSKGLSSMSGFDGFMTDAFRRLPVVRINGGERWRVVEEMGRMFNADDFEKRARGCVDLILVERWVVGIKP